MKNPPNPLPLVPTHRTTIRSRRRVSGSDHSMRGARGRGAPAPVAVPALVAVTAAFRFLGGAVLFTLAVATARGDCRTAPPRGAVGDCWDAPTRAAPRSSMAVDRGDDRDVATRP